MSNPNIRIRANRSTGELELEGPLNLVQEWWDKIWPELKASASPGRSSPALAPAPAASTGAGAGTEIFGEFYSEFRSGLTDGDKMLIAGAFVQNRDPDRAFTTKNASQLLIEQNIKVGNPSECVRRLVQAKRAFVVPGGKFRISATGLESLQTLKEN